MINGALTENLFVRQGHMIWPRGVVLAERGKNLKLNFN